MSATVVTVRQADVPLASDDFSHSLALRKSLNRAQDRMTRLYSRVDDAKSPHFVKTVYDRSLQGMTLEPVQTTEASILRSYIQAFEQPNVQSQRVRMPAKIIWEQSFRASTSTMVLYGEPFYWKNDEILGRVLEHSQWSLLGYGETDAAAVRMLVERIFVTADALLPADGEMSPPVDKRGRALRRYLARVVRERAAV